LRRERKRERGVRGRGRGRINLLYFLINLDKKTE